MAVPKRKTSKQRKNKRRTHISANVATISQCSNCGSPVEYHRVCAECGYYRGKQAIEKVTI